MKKKENDYFIFPDIPEVLYPVWAENEYGKLCNFKTIVYPNSRCAKKFTRRNQLIHRSLQAKIFDAFINIGYFNPLIVYKEFPVIIDNSLRLPNQEGMYYLADYAFPELRLFVELDTKETHNLEKDKIRDNYLKQIGITVYRINNLEKVETQKKEFPKLIEFMKSLKIQEPITFNFYKYGGK